MANLKFNNMNKIYPSGIQAVYDFNLDIEDGEFIVLVGPSGCGKSTLLRMIAGLETITSGDLIHNGKKINNVAPADRDIAMVFQNYALYGNMTVYENMGFSLTVRHENSDKIHSEVMKTADIVRLKEYLNRKPKNLSGGQRQRVALGRSIVRDSNIFLMDEPLSNLDAKLRNETRKELVQLHNQLKATFVYVTHDQVEAMTMADRIVIMDNGYVQQIGTPIEVYLTPENIFVGGFIGSPPMNFIKGTIVDGQFRSESMSLEIPKDRLMTLEAYEDKQVILGVRPEHFSDEPIKLERFKNASIQCTVDVVEFLGSEMLIYFNLGNNKLISKVRARRQRIPDKIQLAISMDNVHFFDVDTEKRIR